ncbi:predicted protein [Sclerotinia sclerotiorum 1980 UF-70]|uniref:Uncharacterized protein n=1 Tax=Sclerotinia sclerotiorum (strain ATCC 18683 / 1980 / Ss-1) TaxID=665079 RepID=A7EL94_SCLS1|nr:predicted protein [Sclerotinia sclerotiorum 1980 UF-70]EDO03610.1 predicted protein [Sclerotinia sclerotiorum 1980 UF-70]
MVEVVDWEMLGGFYWDDEEKGRGYPRLFVREMDEDGFVDTTEILIKNEGWKETEMRNDNSQQPKYVGELQTKGHGKNNKRRREERGESSVIKKAKPAALNIISNSR